MELAAEMDFLNVPTVRRDDRRIGPSPLRGQNRIKTELLLLLLLAAIKCFPKQLVSMLILF